MDCCHIKCYNVIKQLSDKINLPICYKYGLDIDYAKIIENQLKDVVINGYSLKSIDFFNLKPNGREHEPLDGEHFELGMIFGNYYDEYICNLNLLVVNKNNIEYNMKCKIDFYMFN